MCTDSNGRTLAFATLALLLCKRITVVHRLLRPCSKALLSKLSATNLNCMKGHRNGTAPAGTGFPPGYFRDKFAAANLIARDTGLQQSDGIQVHWRSD